MNLETTYLGLKLRTPLVVAASPLSQSLDNIRRLEDAGASTIVLHSLFEEQLRIELNDLPGGSSAEVEGSPQGPGYLPGPSDFRLRPEAYLEHLARAKEAVHVPIVGSLNGTTFGGWTTCARQIEQAGADALELNIYAINTDPTQTADDIETGYLSIAAAVKAQVRIPVAVKLSPFFTNLALFARQLDATGVDGLVLFNRFYQPDVDLDTLELTPNIQLSTPNAMRLPLRWIAILHGHLRASLAATSGIHRATDAIKMLMAGADVTMLCSALLARGIDYLPVVEREMREWIEQHGYESVAQLKGQMSQQKCADPAAFERGQYMRALATYPGGVTRAPASGDR